MTASLCQEVCGCTPVHRPSLRQYVRPMPTEKERLFITLTEEERLKFEELLLELKRRRLVRQTLTVNGLALRLAQERMAQVWQDLKR